ncbi:acyltransferase [Sporichthya sp.]|uniref:acyltransferase family protein n=1 Tax=Sporichthya sp. TaxID=65475 RepID=UPI00181465F3|nr:acyltransferase [Sporichthya sp.]MBA3743257.1 acyltransferase [Sporichthya sp.]
MFAGEAPATADDAVYLHGPSDALQVLPWVLIALAVAAAFLTRRRSAGPAAAPVGTVAPSPGGTVGHVQVIDGLRGIAILLVVLFHFWQLSFYAIRIPVPGGDLEYIQVAGFLGVELFFFLSAFCLFYPHALAMAGERPVPTLRHFYHRRAIKIVPSYLIVLFVLGTCWPTLYPSTWHHGKLADLGVHLGFVHNFWAQTRSSFDGVLWSLAVEVQFYVVFPLLARMFRHLPWATAALMVAVALSYRSWARGLPLGEFELKETLLPGFLDLFAFGMLTAYLVVRLQHLQAAAADARRAFTALALVAVVTVLFMFRWLADVRYDGPPLVVWQSMNRHWIGLLFGCVAVASVFAVAAWRRLLANRALLFLSAISYNLYLWHQAVGVLLRKYNVVPADTDVPTDDPRWRWTYLLVALTLSVIVATAITYAIERPLLRLGLRGATRAALTRLRAVPVTGRPGTPSAEEAGNASEWRRHSQRR